jgi:hypothetical protein
MTPDLLARGPIEQQLLAFADDTDEGIQKNCEDWPSSIVGNRPPPTFNCPPPTFGCNSMNCPRTRGCPPG